LLFILRERELEFLGWQKTKAKQNQTERSW